MKTDRPTWLAWIIVPLALGPVGLAFLGTGPKWIVIVLASICVAAPCAGFWIGEMRGNTGSGRAARGCVATLAMFAFYLLWTILLVPLIQRRWG